MRSYLLHKVAEQGAGSDEVLSEKALHDAVRLLRHRGPGIDLEVLTVCGLYFFRRFLAQSSERKLVEFVAAVQLLGPVHAAGTTPLPGMITSTYDSGICPWEHFSADTGFTTDPDVWWVLHLEPTARYTRSGDRATLLLCVDLLRLARQAAGPDHPSLTRLLTMLSVQLGLLRAALTEDREVCRESLEVCGLALDRIPPDDPSRSVVWGNQGLSALTLAKLDDDVDAARLAVDCFRAGCRLGSDDPEATHAVNLGGALVELGRLTDDHEPCYEALRVFRGAAATAGPVALSNLSALLRDLLSAPGHERAVTEFCRAALAHPPPELPADVPALRALYLLALQAAERDGHRDLEAQRDLIALGRRILAVAQEDQALGEAANNIASSLVRLAQLMHDPAVAREAVDLAERAVGHARRAEALDPSVALANLAQAHSVLFELTGDLEAQREAVHHSRLAVAELESTDAVHRASLIATHGMILHRYATRLNDQALLHEALDAHRRAWELPDLPEHVQVNMLCGLTAILTDLYSLVPGEPVTTIREAVSHGERALSLTAADDRAASFALNELCRARRLLAATEDDADGLRAAIALADRALALGESAVPVTLTAVRVERATAQIQLAGLTQDDEMRESALAGLDRVVGAADAQPTTRMRAALMQTSLAGAGGAAAMDRLANAVDVLRLNVASGPLWSDREHALRSYSLLTEQIIAIGLAADDPVRTVHLLERSRGLLSEDVMDIRNDTRLEPATAVELHAVSAQLRALDARDRSLPQGMGRQRELDRRIAAERVELTTRWNRLRATVPEPPPLDLAAIAAEGPVVMVASASSGAHALLLTGDPEQPVRALDLPELDFRTASERVLTFLTARHYAISDAYPLRVRLTAQAEVRDTLAWLWECAVEPVLRALGLTSTPEGAWPRLWWCPLGFLNYLPWHAAGADTGALDRVISSYTASLRALDFVRRMEPSALHGRTLIVAQSEPPSAPALHGVEAEVAALRPLLRDATLLAGPTATRANVLAALPGHANVHLACHAMTEVHSPGTSKLLLADHEAAPLTVADLAALQLSGRQLAMLSACSTSEVSPDLTDESLHLTGAFQLAGFRHVIGALWPVSDGVADEVTRSFYGHLTDSGSHPPHTDDSARALHTAVRELRERYPATPTIWASYVHTGA
ncbi:CHAT domain-containing protein [Streptomyces sp. NPDC021093]|uniref:CHAT domain-containing protein n=1 Tax=Streptomyces sp. NPDC021093 TaxID=3365112 RepID=UPI0037A6B537